MIEEIKQAAGVIKKMEQAVKLKEEELSSQFGAIGLNEGGAQFATAYDVEKVTGKVPELIERDSDHYPYEAFVVVDDFKFYAVMPENEMEEYRNERTRELARVPGQ